MTQKSNERAMRNPKFDALVAEMMATHNTKSHDYSEDGDPLSNLRRAEKFGVEPFRGVLVRLSDKWSRLEQLTSGKAPKHESIRDTLMDQAVYSLLAILLLDEAASTASPGNGTAITTGSAGATP